MTNPAPAADKTKDATPPVKTEAGDAATSAKAKLQEDAAKPNDATKATPTDGKKESSDATSKKAEPEEKSWLDKAREEALDFLGFNGSSAVKVEGKPEAKPKQPEPKSKEELHLDIPKLDYGFTSNLKLEPTAIAKPGDKPADAKEEKTGLSWLWDKAYSGVTSAGKYVTDSFSGAWDSLTGSATVIEQGISNFGHNETTVKGAAGEYKITNDKGELVEFTSEANGLLTKINTDGKSIVDEKTGMKYTFAPNGDMALDNKAVTVISDKDGHRIITDKKSGDVFDYDKKTNEIYRVEKDGTHTKYSKDEVEKKYGEWIRTINELSDKAEDYGKKLAAGDVATHGDNVTVRRANDMVTANKVEHTMVIEGLKPDGSLSGVKHSIDFKTGEVVNEAAGVKTTQRLRDFLKEHPEYRMGPDGIFQFDCDRKGGDNRFHRQRMRLNAGHGTDPTVVATNAETGETVKIDSPGGGKVVQVHADASGKQLGDKVLVDPADKAHAYQEVNAAGVVTAKVDTSKPDAAFSFSDDQGNNILSVADRNAMISYGDYAIGISSDDKVYDSHGTLFHDGSIGASERAQASATEAVASANAAAQAASLASSLVQSAMSNPGSMDVGYLTSMLSSAYNAAASAMAQSITSFSATGMIAANSAMATVSSKLGQVGMVQAARANLDSQGVFNGPEREIALNSSVFGGSDIAKAVEVARQRLDITTPS